ncbi:MULTISPECIES: nitrogenase component 1 [unclassified Clostridium]|uniref:nitrogenase component 1 n=1 Tax=unclassified Clostridium TaxID=2614128 RepID=UPI0025C71495|nr:MULTISPECIES: nitrogenase component 1 [unclassified Clostridium]
MMNLCKYLPPIASDYSGVSSIIFEMNSLNILYSPGGCDHSIIEIDETRNFFETSFLSTSLNEIHVITGAENEFIESLKKIDISNFDFISLIGTPISALTGVDFNSIASKIERELKIPVVVFNTSGFESYPIGISEGLFKLGEKFLNESNIGLREDYINVIGYIPFVLGNRVHLDELFEVLHSSSYKINTFGEDGYSLNNIKLLSKAKINIVISLEGLKLAKYMKEKFNIPYILELPVGVTGMRNYIDVLEEFNISIDKDIRLRYSNINIDNNYKLVDKKIFIVGEPFIATAIKKCLKEDFTINNISILSTIKKGTNSERFYVNNGYSEVEFFEEEKKILEQINSADIIIADPIFQNFIPSQNKVKFIPLPYFGLSGREFSHTDYEYIGEKGFNYFKKYLEN